MPTANSKFWQFIHMLNIYHFVHWMANVLLIAIRFALLTDILTTWRARRTCDNSSKFIPLDDSNTGDVFWHFCNVLAKWICSKLFCSFLLNGESGTRRTYSCRLPKGKPITPKKYMKKKGRSFLRPGSGGLREKSPNCMFHLPPLHEDGLRSASPSLFPGFICVGLT